MELFLFGVNVLILISVWKFMIRKTILDNSRDKLFDLRDELRDTFLERGWGLSSPMYKKLRDLLNGHLRFTENYSVSQIVFVEAGVKSNKHLEAELHAQFEKKFLTGNAEMDEYIKSIRSRSLVAVMDFAVYSSGFLLFLSAIITPFFLIAKMVSVVNRGVDAAMLVCFRSAFHFGKVASNTFTSSARLIAATIFAPDVFESHAYHKGIA
jgi:hypothetical protein